MHFVNMWLKGRKEFCCSAVSAAPDSALTSARDVGIVMMKILTPSFAPSSTRNVWQEGDCRVVVFYSRCRTRRLRVAATRSLRSCRFDIWVRHNVRLCGWFEGSSAKLSTRSAFSLMVKIYFLPLGFFDLPAADFVVWISSPMYLETR